MDNYSSAGNSLGSGISEQLYHGRIHPYPSGVSRYLRGYPNHPGPKNSVVITVAPVATRPAAMKNQSKVAEKIDSVMEFDRMKSDIKD